MKRQRRPFRMKQFEVSDVLSGNKIGVDGVLLGSWVPVNCDMNRILDVGCGCGIISLMMAQRLGQSRVIAIDIEPMAVYEAEQNVRNSIFKERINVFRCDFDEMIGRIQSGEMEKFDLIVSNPPFYESGANPYESERMLARHAGTLSPEILLIKGHQCLNDSGTLAFIAPYCYMEKYLSIARQYGWSPIKGCIVKGNPEATPKRVMLVFSNKNDEDNASAEMQTLTIEYKPGEYTPEYRLLGQPFYLKF